MSRTYISFHLHGLIATVAGLDAICAAAFDNDMLPDDGSGHYRDAEDIKASIYETIIDPAATYLRFVREDSYTSNADDLKSYCIEHGASYGFHWDAADEFPAGQEAYTPDAGATEATSDGDEAVVPVSELRACLAAPDPVAALRALADRTDMANGKGLPDLTVSDEVMGHLVGLFADGPQKVAS